MITGMQNGIVTGMIVQHTYYSNILPIDYGNDSFSGFHFVRNDLVIEGFIHESDNSIKASKEWKRSKETLKIYSLMPNSSFCFP